MSTPLASSLTLFPRGANGASLDTLGPYRLCRVLGAGGMATVYLGYDSRLAGVHRLIALKCIHPHLASDREIVEMFSDEATVASAIAHPNVCRVSDFGAYEGVRFLAMEYLCGEPLSSVRSALGRARTDGSLEPLAWLALVVRILADACEGLHALHELRHPGGRPWHAVHRDVSPDNIMVTCAGAVKIVDFGIVKACGQRHRTAAGIIKGKLAYLAPEVLCGAESDRRADVWSLGVIAWELLCGQRLFRRASDTAILDAIAREELVAPSRCVEGLPRELDAIVARALEREPDHRFATARMFARALLGVAREHRACADDADLRQWLEGAFSHDSVCHQRTLDQLMFEPTLIPVDLDDPVLDEPALDPPPAPARPRRPNRRWLLLVGVLALLSAAASSRRAPAVLAATVTDELESAQRVASDSEAALSVEIRRGARVLWRGPIEAAPDSTCVAPQVAASNVTTPSPAVPHRGREPEPRARDGHR